MTRPGFDVAPASVARLTRLACALLGLGLSAAARAHPHVWITQNVELQARGTSIYTIREKWVFTHGFPVSTLVNPSRIPKAGSFDAQTTEALRTQAFESLKSDDYFTHVYSGGKQIPIGAPQGFAAAMESGNLAYTFLIPLAVPVDPTRSDVVIGIWDDSFFVDVQPAATAAVSVAGSTAKTCRGQVFEDRQHAIYGGAIYPLASRITC